MVRGLSWRPRVETLLLPAARPFIPVMKGKEGRVGQGETRALLRWPGGEDFIWVASVLSELCEAGLSTKSRVWKASGWHVCRGFEMGEEVNSDSHFEELGHQHRRISEKWLRWPGWLDGPFEICVYELGEGNSLEIRRLGFQAFTVEDPGSIPGQRTKIPQA